MGIFSGQNWFWIRLRSTTWTEANFLVSTKFKLQLLRNTRRSNDVKWNSNPTSKNIRRPYSTAMGINVTRMAVPLAYPNSPIFNIQSSSSNPSNYTGLEYSSHRRQWKNPPTSRRELKSLCIELTRMDKNTTQHVNRILHAYLKKCSSTHNP